MLTFGLISGHIFGAPASADTGMQNKKSASSSERFFLLGSIFGRKDTKAKYEPVSLPKNVQTLPLLQAPKNIDPQAKSEAKLVVVDDSALSNENTGVDGANIAAADFKTNSDEISVYTVREGDTLSGIADMFNVTKNTIISTNDLGTSPIKPGQNLVILPISGLRYTTKKGDTLASIAKASGGDVDEIAEFNDLSSNQTLAVGTTIIIPDAEGMVGPGHNTASVTKKPTVKVAATVKKVASKGYYACPINATRTQGIHGNNGVDYGAPIGTSVIAAADGTVLIAKTGWNGGYGTYIVIKHGNGTQTLYGHLNQLLIGPGEKVVKGQVIGKMGNTGQSTGPHLHFEVRGASNGC